MFNPKKCVIPTIYCGKDKIVPETIHNNTKYIRHGTSYECMTKGFGAGLIAEKLKNLPANSLQRIKYIGDIHEANFKKSGIHTTTQLISRVKKLKTNAVEKLLKNILKRKNGTLDTRAYNSSLLFVYQNGVSINLPQCVNIKSLPW